MKKLFTLLMTILLTLAGFTVSGCRSNDYATIEYGPRPDYDEEITIEGDDVPDSGTPDDPDSQE